MYEDGPLDEQERRERRDERLASSISGVDDRPWWERSGLMGTDGMGTPESGYGPGGVENPAYNPPAPPQPVKQATADQNTNMLDPNRGAPPVQPPPPTGGGGVPQFQPPAAAAAPAPSVQQPGITDEVTKILQQRLKDLQNPGDVASDPLYQQAVRQHQIATLRDADRQRKSLAERSAASGTRASGGFNVGVQAINERSGENAAQYRAGLAMDRLQAREQQLVQAIQMARAVGQDDIANQLELQRLQLQQELGRSDLALRGELGRGQLGLGYDNLGFNYADLITRANRDATIAALNGGG